MLKRLFCVWGCLFGLLTSDLHAFDQVIIWGHKMHSHTHSYIHHAFYMAFQAMNYSTYWFDKDDNLENFDFSNSLFITEGQVDDNIPLRDDCQYLLHNADPVKYRILKPENWANFQVYTDDVLSNPHAIKIEPCIYYDVLGKCLFMPWATDLFPNEIDHIKKEIQRIPTEKYINWIGTVGDGLFGNIEQLRPFQQACEENDIHFLKRPDKIEKEAHIQFIQRSFMAPTIVGRWQEKAGYIPCRIFKNISYGKMPLTNSYRVYELFDKKIVYNSDTYQLFYDALERQKTFSRKDLFELMDLVRDKHTYLNRVQTMLDFLKLVHQTHCHQLEGVPYEI